MFIRVTAAFKDENQPDYEQLGIVSSDDEPQWKDMHIHHDMIVSIHVEKGETMLLLMTGEYWAVKQTAENVIDQCQMANKSYRK